MIEGAILLGFQAGGIFRSSQVHDPLLLKLLYARVAGIG
jgi:hypothetical protein